MEFRQLRYFLAVADYLQFTEAAAHLGMAQPPLSQQILKLEREVGTRLFIRHPRRVELTAAGLLFRERARRILGEAELALNEVKQAARGVVGRLALGFAASTVFHPRVPELLQCYRARYPDVVMRCEESNSVALMDKLLDGQIDAAIVRLPLACHDLHMTQLAKEEILGVLPASHPLHRRRKIALSALAADNFVLPPRSLGPELYDTILEACREAGFTPTLGLESPQLSSTTNLVAAGFGVSLIPESLRQVQGKGVSYHALEGTPLETSIALLTRPREQTATINNLMQLTRELNRSQQA
ncbi:LysR family transcriptional regulator [Pseudoduganella sp. FT25W]|uniref:LysR family transcriptional regulator n=1 Tax=Duganella alba TaxID=2666081 RepID=A0A6L5QFC7_9BURK|nr:LysR family transcriptional regulator [Duganella alba]MRX08464.1 LysR family transcriptional regulator [Duganella alba]MRX17062.1 LysR family transcriptional regulator [Duganella alba]